MIKDETKRLGSISSRAMIKIRNLITFMGFPGLIQIQGLASWNINILWKNIKFIDVVVSLQYFTLPVELVYVIFSFLFR